MQVVEDIWTHYSFLPALFVLLAFIFGLVSIAGFLSDFVYLLLKQMLPSRLSTYKRNNSWAVITGCTDGIGKEFALQLASKGFNLILLSRTQAKLEELQKEVGKVDSFILAVDFMNPNYDSIARVIAEAAARGPITMLVNNVGMTHEFPEHFLESSAATVNSIIKMNIDSLNNMTRVVLPHMVENKLGLVLNIGSGSAWWPCPMLAPYAASKQYLDSLTQALQIEYESNGIHFEALTPLYVATKLSKMRPGFTIPTPKAYVSSALSQVGRQSEAHAGYFSHDLIHFIGSLLPTGFVMRKVYGHHKSIRRRAIAKKERMMRENADKKND